MANICECELRITSKEGVLTDELRAEILSEITNEIAYCEEVDSEDWDGEIFEIQFQSKWTLPREELQKIAVKYKVEIHSYGVERGNEYCEFLTFNSDGSITE